jgi:hypothetical protein
MATAAALLAETSNGGVAFGRSDANQQKSTVVRRRAIRPFVAAEFGFCLAAAPENGDVNFWGKRVGVAEGCEQAEALLRGLLSPYSSQA